MSVSWEFFAGRRSVSLREILEAEGISSYEELVISLKHMGVRAPLEKEVAWMFNEKSDKIQVPCDPNMTAEEMQEARKEITNIIIEGDPEALVPQIKAELPTGGIKPLDASKGGVSKEEKTPQRRKRRTRKTTKAEK